MKSNKSVFLVLVVIISRWCVLETYSQVVMIEVFRDDFNGTELNWKEWFYPDFGGTGTGRGLNALYKIISNEDPDVYSESTFSDWLDEGTNSHIELLSYCPNNAEFENFDVSEVSGGKLILKTKKLSTPKSALVSTFGKSRTLTFDYIGAALMTRRRFKRGEYEIKTKMEQREGVISAWWLFSGVDYKWEEFDFIEAMGKSPNYRFGINYIWGDYPNSPPPHKLSYKHKADSNHYLKHQNVSPYFKDQYYQQPFGPLHLEQDNWCSLFDTDPTKKTAKCTDVNLSKSYTTNEVTIKADWHWEHTSASNPSQYPFIDESEGEVVDFYELDNGTATQRAQIACVHNPNTGPVHDVKYSKRMILDHHLNEWSFKFGNRNTVTPQGSIDENNLNEEQMIVDYVSYKMELDCSSQKAYDTWDFRNDGTYALGGSITMGIDLDGDPLNNSTDYGTVIKAGETYPFVNTWIQCLTWELENGNCYFRPDIVEALATTEVRLKKGFKAERGSIFRAALVNCAADGYYNSGSNRMGINENEQSTQQVIPNEKLVIHPNPSNDYIMLSGLSIPNSEIRIIDFTGKTVQKKFNHFHNQPLDISQLKSGIYKIIVVNSVNIYNASFVKN